MNRFAIVVIMLGCLVGAVKVFSRSAFDDSYYHSLYNTHPLTIAANDLAVQLDATNPESAWTALAERHPQLAAATLQSVFGDRFVYVHFPTAIESGTTETLDSDSAVLRRVPVYKLRDGLNSEAVLLVSDEVIVAFDSPVVWASAVETLRPFGLEVVEVNHFNTTELLAKLTPQTRTSCVAVANSLYNISTVKWATPNFYNTTIPCSVPGDNYYSEEFWIPIIQADSAWLVYNPHADTVSVAVIDDGVESHLDLEESRIDDGWDAAGFDQSSQPDGDPSPGGSSDAHGMRVTGILAAALNDTGVVGVNPWCRIRPFKIQYDKGGYVGNYKRALAIDSAVAAGAVIISCSWLSTDTAQTAELEVSILNASDSTTDSRSHTCVFFFAVGNEADTVRFPANMPQVIAIGGVDEDGNRCTISNYGSALDLMGVIDCIGVCDANMHTIDQMGADGMNPGEDCDEGDLPDLDYTRRMNGTSSACPQVSGVAALLLSRVPSLVRGGENASPWDTTTSEMVRDILAKSADDLGATGWDQYTGYGRLNAWHAMLSLIRGDVDNSGAIDDVDVAVEIDIVFYGGHSPLDDRLADIGIGEDALACNGFADATDLAYLIDHVFYGGPPPVPCFWF